MSVIPATGQAKDSFVCNEVDRKVLGTLKITKVWRWRKYDDECDFEGDLGSEGFSIDIEKYKTEDESKKAFSMDFRHLTSIDFDEESVQYLERNNFWSEAKGYSDSADTDHLIMLRYKNINITLISSNYYLILGLEPLLRSIDFEQHL